MKKSKTNVGTIIFIAFVLLIIIMTVIISGLSERTLMSKPDIIGNTAGNLYNYGLFCDDGERIYFSNPNDQGMLYSMSYDLDDFQFLLEDNARYINADQNYIYYSRNNNLKEEAARSIFVFYSNGIFRCNKKGKNLKMLWNKPIGSAVYYNNRIYYQNYMEKKDLSVHCIGIDGENDFEMFTDDARAVSIYNSRLYFAGKRKDHSLHSSNTSSGGNTVEIEGDFYEPIVNANGVYYIANTDGYRLKQTDLNGEKTKTLVNKRCSCFNISADGRYIYYQVDNGDESGVYMLDTSTGTETTVKLGNYKWLNIIRDYCFFTDFEEQMAFCYKPGIGVERFNPPKLSE